MRKLYLGLLLALSYGVSNAQVVINAPDTICKGTQITITTNLNASSYAYSIGKPTGDPSSMSSTLITAKGLVSAPRGIAIQYENGGYYGFVVTDTGHLIRMNFGASVGSSPNMTDLGDFSEAIRDTATGLDIVKDGEDWYGFVVNLTYIVRLDFGNSLTNTPTATRMDIGFSLWNPEQITMKNYNGEWLGFVINRGSGSLVRLNFGSSITNTPTATYVYDNAPGADYYLLRSPTAFTLYEEEGKWYAYMTSSSDMGNNRVSRYSFGTNLKNDNPVGTNLGNLGPNKLSRPRGIIMVKTEDSLYALIANHNSDIVKISFAQGAATGTPLGIDYNDLGKPNTRITYWAPFWEGNKLSLLASSSTDSGIYKIGVYTLPTQSQTSYSSSTYTTTMTKGGLQNITLFGDHGKQGSSSVATKQIFVVDEIKIALKQTGNLLTVSGPKCDKYVWKLNGVVMPDVTTDTFTATEGGIYTVIGSIADCNNITSYLFEPVGVKAVRNQNAINVYPNPTSGVFNVDVKGINERNVEIKCFNVLGSLVTSKSVATVNGELKTTMDLSSLPKGAYHVKVSTTSGDFYMKQIVLQ